MKVNRLLLLACAAGISTTFAADNPFEAFKGKVKEGMYEYKMDMDMGQMPGMPPGMGKGRDGKMPENCEIKNFKMSGNTASYTMICKGGPDMVADNTITFRDGGYTMDMKMQMDRGGQAMNMKQHMEGKYLGPCSK